MTTTTLSKKEFQRQLQAALASREWSASRIELAPGNVRLTPGTPPLTPAEVTQEYLNPAAHADIEHAAARLYYARIAAGAGAYFRSFGPPPWNATAKAARRAGKRAYTCHSIVSDLMSYDD